MDKKIVQSDLDSGDKQKTPLALLLLLPLFFLFFSFSHSRQLCDMDLAPRLLALSFFVGISGIYFAISGFRNTNIDLHFIKNPVFLCFSFWIFIQLWSSNQSFNRGEAFFEDLKLLLIYATLCVFILLSKKSSDPLYLIAQSICIAVIASLFYFFVSLEFHNKSIFNILKDASFNPFLFANHSNKNSFAEFLLLAAPFLGSLVFRQNKIWRYLALITLLLVFVLLFILKSAAVLIAFLLVFLFISYLYIVWKFKANRMKIGIYLFLFLLITLVLAVSNKTIQGRLSNALIYSSAESVHKIKVNSVVERALLWKSSFLMIKEKPLTGFGLCNWKLLYPIYGDPNEKNILGDSLKPTRPHNDYLQFWAESGLFALLTFLGIFIFGAVKLIQKLNANSDSFHAIQLLVVLAGLSGYVFVCLFGYASERPFNLLLLTCYIALCIHYTPIPSKNKSSSSNKSIKLILSLLFILLSANGISINLQRIKDEANLQQAIQSKRKTDYRSMLAYLKKINADDFPIDYTATPIKWYLATALYATGNIEDAKKNYLEALTQAPYHIQLLTDVGVIFDQGNQKQLAEEYYQKALALNPKFKDVIYNYCALKFNTGRVSEAYDLISTLPSNLIDHHKTIDFKKIILVALRDSVLLEQKLQNQDSMLVNKINPNLLLRLDSIAFTQKLQIKDLILKNISQ